MIQFLMVKLLFMDPSSCVFNGLVGGCVDPKKELMCQQDALPITRMTYVFIYFPTHKRKDLYLSISLSFNIRTFSSKNIERIFVFAGERYEEHHCLLLAVATVDLLLYYYCY